MSEISDAIQTKCLAFGDRIIKLNDYLLEQAANKKPGYKMVNGKRVYNKSIPVHLQAVSNLCNQLLRSGTSVGANNAEASSAISKADFKSKSYIALKEARESLYWIDLLHRNGYLDDKQHSSIYYDTYLSLVMSLSCRLVMSKQREALGLLRELGASVRQLERLTGISRGVIQFVRK